jgi:hypothetical protein
MEIKAPYVPYDAIRETARAFLNEHNREHAIPVPIEEIVEFRFEMDIVPEPGLHAHFDIDSYITHDLREIRVDESVYESRPGRYRFSLAHELGHRILHQEVFAELSFDNVDEWKRLVISAIPEKQYSYLEFQASAFAGLVLVPKDDLQTQYDDVCGLLERGGFSLRDDFEVARNAIADRIGEFFLVSAAVVQRRLEYDGIWKKSR